MITRYEELSRKIEALRGAGRRCADNHSNLSNMWFAKAQALSDKLSIMPIEHAMRVVGVAK